ncbi:hypothetical protein [Glaciibacter superstes]|uniref:hypothetical protein n=1 Tax=Glaciibacter superstes TaxID=501023 RepID=UPI0003B64CE4|nr:hypothetical protein [Glaciibacter superstes]
MAERIRLPRDLTLAPFLYAEARERGIGRSRLRGADLTAPYRGVRMPATGDSGIRSVTSLTEAYAARMPRGQVFSHVTAAMLHGFPLPYHLQSDLRLHVTVPAGSRAPQMEGVIGHELAVGRMDVELLDALPVTTPLQTWIDLGTILKLGQLVEVADFLCAGKTPRYTPSELVTTAASLIGRRGCRTLRQAAALARARVDSPKETQTRLLLIEAKFPEPVTNFEVVVAAPFTLHPDLAWPEFRAGVDYEGDAHRERKRFRSDITRRELFEDAGWRVVRITDDDLKDSGRGLIRRVRSVLMARGWRG